jgi:hypothetical protein
VRRKRESTPQKKSDFSSTSDVCGSTGLVRSVNDVRLGGMCHATRSQHRNPLGRTDSDHVRRHKLSVRFEIFARAALRL